jgi:NTE family protein
VFGIFHLNSIRRRGPFFPALDHGCDHEEDRSMQRETTALVLGGGGMFGAYEAGVWKALEGVFRPGIVVGASIGALNGWAIAGGCPADEWIAEWLSLGAHAQLRMRLPGGVFDGLFDSGPLQAYVRRLTRRFQPKVRFGAALLSVRRLETQVFWDDAVTWRHLCASCGVPILLKQYRIDGSRWADGGLLSALPLQAAIDAGATRIVAVNVLPAHPPAALRIARGLLKTAARYRPKLAPAGVEVLRIEPGDALGAWRNAYVWDRECVRAWMERGRQDAERALESAGKPDITN